MDSDKLVSQDLVNIGLTRREMVRITAGAAGGGLIPLYARPVSASPLAGALLFVGGLVVGEIVLGVLRAYDIDIGGTAEKFVRSYRTNDYRRKIAVESGGSRRLISPLGQSDSGFVQVNTHGVLAARTNRRSQNAPSGFWVHGAAFWVATGEDAAKARAADLDVCRCGYPVGLVKTEDTPRKNPTHSEITQRFEGGYSRVVIDLTALPDEGDVTVSPIGEQKVMLEWDWRQA